MSGHTCRYLCNLYCIRYSHCNEFKCNKFMLTKVNAERAEAKISLNKKGQKLQPPVQYDLEQTLKPSRKASPLGKLLNFEKCKKVLMASSSKMKRWLCYKLSPYEMFAQFQKLYLFRRKSLKSSRRRCIHVWIKLKSDIDLRL